MSTTFVITGKKMWDSFFWRIEYFSLPVYDRLVFGVDPYRMDELGQSCQAWIIPKNERKHPQP